MKKLITSRIAVTLSFALFGALLLSGWTLWDKQTPQAQSYMLGRLAYTTSAYDLAVEYFDQSYTAYQDSAHSESSVFLAPSSLELAELSQHFKALALVKMGNSKLAVLTFKEALKLTTDEALARANVGEGLLRKLTEDRKTTQIDFEILFHQKPQQAQQEGKGKGQGQADKGEKQSEDPSSGQQPGKTDRDAL